MSRTIQIEDRKDLPNASERETAFQVRLIGLPLSPDVSSAKLAIFTVAFSEREIDCICTYSILLAAKRWAENYPEHVSATEVQALKFWPEPAVSGSHLSEVEETPQIKAVREDVVGRFTAAAMKDGPTACIAMPDFELAIDYVGSGLSPVRPSTRRCVDFKRAVLVADAIDCQPR